MRKGEMIPGWKRDSRSACATAVKRPKAKDAVGDSGFHEGEYCGSCLLLLLSHAAGPVVCNFCPEIQNTLLSLKYNVSY
ncbi:hypothetical protein ACFX13_013942 [Malus domestica]